jgi:hypothetical protein
MAHVVKSGILKFSVSLIGLTKVNDSMTWAAAARRSILSAWPFWSRISQTCTQDDDSIYLGSTLLGLASLRLLRHGRGVLLKVRNRFND